MNARTAFEYGLASTLLGASLVPAAVVAIPTVEGLSFTLYTSPVHPLKLVVPIALIALIQVLAAVGFAAGIRSIVAARRYGRPLAMGAVGTLLNAVAFITWLLVAIYLYGYYSLWWH